MNLLAASDDVALQATTWSEEVMRFLPELPEVFSEIPPWQCAILIPLGLLSLLYGLKLLKAMVVVYSALVGAIAGWVLAGYFGFTGLLQQFIGLGLGAVLLGVCGWLFVQIVFGFLGGVACALVGAALFYSTGGTNVILLAAGVGFVVGVVLAVVAFRALVVATTAVVGAHLVVTGAVVLLYYIPGVKTALVDGFSSHRYLLPLLIGIPATLGIIFQAYQLRAGQNK